MILTFFKYKNVVVRKNLFLLQKNLLLKTL